MSGMNLSCVRGASAVIQSREELEAFVAAHEGCPDLDGE